MGGTNLCDLVAQRTFSSQHTLIAQLNPDRNHNLRVMSTPEFPVPYWQRSFRHDPTPMDAQEIDLTGKALPISDTHVLAAKEVLKMQGKGYIVEAVENHFDVDNYITKFEDSSGFSEAYVDDMLDCLDLVARQNSRIMNEFDLADALK